MSGSGMNVVRREIREIGTTETYRLRLDILRPGRPLPAAQFPCDDESTTHHFGAFLGETLVGIATVLRAPFLDRPDAPALQLRGMATTPEARGLGFGRDLIAACLHCAREQERVDLLWCNARVTALGFYRKLGFEIIGGQFEVPDVGPHFRMFTVLRERADQEL